ncbi:MAG: hypothetical protein JO364_03355 [Pseudonocardiales bacterium]|nr:hypothetical protein [Pseudonocardiales bacterium]MBV9029347.1 hypothetical protein [Pseudonocardiales bacterium]
MKTPARGGGDELLQPARAIQVEVVGRLVETWTDVDGNIGTFTLVPR